ncbi:MAG: helix-turn-helix domain-containing protein, partial [Kiritimatiellae bacterium]|nr:helix-turn-helix domain-containing protein [Kiritimatiellia bacterium]
LPIKKRLAAARRVQGIPQSALAKQAGCAQAAISMMENGNATALSRETIAKIAEILKVELDGEGESAAQPAPAMGIAVCPNGDCPSNVPFAVNGTVAFWPKGQPSGAKFCAYCGEVLEHACANCGAPIGEGAFCQKCGATRVMPPAGDISDPVAWVAARRRELAELKALL